MAIYYSAVECELREVVLKKKPATMLEASPKGTVPVLIDGNRVIDESIDVMAWALDKSDPDSWLDHAIDHELIQRNDDQFKYNLDRYKYADRYPEQAQSCYFDKALDYLRDLEAMLVVDNHGHFYLANSKISLLDVAIFPFVRQFAFVDKAKFDAQNLPKVQAWLNFFLNFEGFLKVMEKYPAWCAEQDGYTLFAT
jgi:glutathione S-transferase